MEKRLKILHFDNNEFNAKLIESKIELKDMSFEYKRIFKIEDYQIALMTDVFDVILCDYSLPDIDWANVVRFAREISPHTSFIFISSGQGEVKPNNVYSHSVQDHFPKVKLENIIPAMTRAVSELGTHDGISCHWG